MYQDLAEFGDVRSGTESAYQCRDQQLCPQRAGRLTLWFCTPNPTKGRQVGEGRDKGLGEPGRSQQNLRPWSFPLNATEKVVSGEHWGQAWAQAQPPLPHPKPAC